MIQILKQTQAIALGLAASLMVGLIGLLDYTFGNPEISFSVFYMLPVGIATWYINRSAGYLVAGWALILRGWIDWSRINLYSTPLVPLDNTLIRACLLIGGVWALGRVKALMLREQQYSRIDFLTELPNSRALFEQAQRELSRRQRTQQPLTLAFMDCDDFKHINDQYGHQTGDKVLRLVAQTLQKHLRMGDFAARLGGDEFVILLPATHCPEAKIVLRRLQAKLQAVMAEQGFDVTFSIGAVSLSQIDKTIDWLIQKADQLMYEGKSAGKNKTVVQAIAPPSDASSASEAILPQEWGSK